MGGILQKSLFLLINYADLSHPYYSEQYLPMYKLIQCLIRPPSLELKKVFLISA